MNTIPTKGTSVNANKSKDDEIRFFFNEPNEQTDYFDSSRYANDRTLDFTIFLNDASNTLNSSEVTNYLLPEIFECEQKASAKKEDDLEISSQKADEAEEVVIVETKRKINDEKDEDTYEQASIDVKGAQTLPSLKIEDEQEAWDNIMRSRTRRSHDKSKQNYVRHSNLKDQTIKKRWGLKQDKNLCKIIKDLSKEGKIDLQQILKLKPIYEAYQSSDVELLADILEWKNPLRTLVTRIQKIYSRGYSKREIKRLKKNLKNLQGQADIDYDELIYDFPGKTMEEFVAICKDLTRCIWDKTLSKFELAERT
ncbi:unnamed protein product [Moneuplotes crassus]|uniref:Uncharacterized protein n=1 Tax=Euplotes crassus TaxID=5936 RepID=A0AAD1Y142_EUPCR|nr:unnamed protein product [Moneuplotes crassus]